jgi:predicted polyphosphate/ATP-dependent NAD kinase
MGADALTEAGFTEVETAHEAREPPSADDTKAAVRRFLDRGIDLILFCGGDGTARNICSVTGQNRRSWESPEYIFTPFSYNQMS